ncbi:RNA polymerase sigma factor [Mangrovibacterium lignilyticum]|uniref:RNA polymerase sigma factor n=1 Tax=Mangrovibacterium lignilyticum TaxID=2668052 RepID=UPI0013D09D20|nr:RNA polymerase sigma-70 factor [Mangrovibacterium lignilyticum]
MPLTSQHIDSKTVQALQKGDVRAFDELFRKYSERLYLFSKKYLKSDEEAHEVVQEVFLYVWEKRNELKPDSSFNAYVFTIAFNLVKKHFNRKARENKFMDEQLYLFLDASENLDREIDYKFLLEKVERIIDSLPERRKAVFMKRKYEGLPIKQIAAELSISPNTVENQLSAAQKHIQSELEKEKLGGFLFFSLFLAI